MMKRSLYLLAVGAVVGGASGCGSDSTDGDGTNQSPVITELAATNADVVHWVGTSELSVQASDPDGDPLTYTWSVSLGALDALDGPDPKLLTAPTERGVTTVTVRVEDGKGGVAEESIDIGVLGWVVPDSALTIPESTYFNIVGFANADDGIVAGGSDTNNVPYIYHFRSGVWTDETKGTAGHMTAGAVVAANNMWVAGGGGLGFHFDGTEWTQFTIPGGCVHGMHAYSADNIWVTPAEAQGIMRQYTGGATDAWTSYPATGAAGMNGVHLAAPDHGWAVGSGGRVYSWDGAAWTQIDIGSTALLKAVYMISTTDGWMGGGGGEVYHWDGSTWTPVTTPAGTRSVNGIYALATDDVWAVGDTGLIMHFNGTEWVELPGPTTKTLNAVTFVSPTDGWATGEAGAVIHIE